MCCGTETPPLPSQTQLRPTPNTISLFLFPPYFHCHQQVACCLLKFYLLCPWSFLFRFQTPLNNSSLHLTFLLVLTCIPRLINDTLFKSGYRFKHIYTLIYYNLNRPFFYYTFIWLCKCTVILHIRNKQLSLVNTFCHDQTIALWFYIVLCKKNNSCCHRFWLLNLLLSLF